MFDHPTIILDKSTLRGLGLEEIEVIQRNYIVIVPPVLINEILGELAHEKEDISSLKNNISRLASRLDDHTTYVYPNAQEIVIEELCGQKIPLTGQPIIFHARRVLNKDGTVGGYIEEPNELKIFRRWAVGDFTNDDISISSEFHNSVRKFDLNSFRKSLTSDKMVLNGNSNTKTLFELIGNVNLTNQKLSSMTVLSFLFDAIPINPDIKNMILDNIKINNVSNLEEYAPYASYYFKVLMAFSEGVKYGAIPVTKKGKAHLDLEYFLYLPFTNAISSYDKQFLDFFNTFCRGGQIYFHQGEVREELTLVKKDALFTRSLRWDSNVNAQDFKSKTYKLWYDKYLPRENLVDRLSSEEHERIASDIMRSINEAIDFSTGEPLYKDYATRYDDWGLDRRFSEVMAKAGEIFEIDRGWSHVKKNISAQQIKDFYSFYADIWHPRTDIISLLPKNLNAFRGFYLGGFELDNINEILYMSLFFDELVIIDPLMNAWYIKEEYNPISNPEQFKQETLKVLWLYISLEPFIKLGKIKIIPSPFFMGSLAYKSAMNSAKSRILPSKLRKTSYKARLEIKYYKRIRAYEALLLLPSNLCIELIIKDIPDLTQSEIDLYVRYNQYMKSVYPTALEQDLFEIKQLTTFSGMNLETALFLASEWGCIPITNSNVRADDLKNVYGNDRAELDGICKVFSGVKFSIIDQIDLPGIYGAHVGGIIRKKSVLLQELCNDVKSRNFRKLKSNSNTEKAIKELQILSENFEMFGSVMREFSSRTLNYLNYEMNIISSMTGANLLGIRELYKLRGDNNRFVSPPIAISFTRVWDSKEG